MEELHVTKPYTAVITIYTHRTNQFYYAYKIVGVAIERKDLVSDLGILMDLKLLFPQYAESVVSKNTEIYTLSNGLGDTLRVWIPM